MASPVRLNSFPSVRGNDGNWVVYSISVGNPPQSFAVLPATVLSDVWAISTAVCQYQTDAQLTNCQVNRGSLFNPELSNTWEYLFDNSSQAFSLGIGQNYGWSQSDGGVFGHDTAILTSEKGTVPISNDVVIGTMNTNFTDTGFIGLGSKQVSLSTSTNSSNTNSLLQILRDAGTIPSMSYSYSAGAYYNDTTGLLILGGYDSASYIPNDVQFTFGPNPSNVLSINLLSISTTAGGSTTTLSDSSVSAVIDSTVSELWLPETWCDNFQKAFNLTFNSNNQLYTLDADAIASNNKKNPFVTIQIANTQNANGPTVSINLPWSALNNTYSSISDPDFKNKPYFSIRKTSGPTYTLGRAFLQEAVLTVDHERRNFSISQVVELTPSVQPNIVAISRPSSTDSNGGGSSGTSSSTPTPTPIAGSSSGGGISGGAIGGIVVAVVVIAAIIAGLLLWRRRSRRSRYQTPEEAKADTPGPQRLPPSAFNEKSAPAEMPTPRPGNSTDPMSEYHAQQRQNAKEAMAMSNGGTLELQGDMTRAQSPAPAYRPHGSEPISMDGGAMATKIPAELPATRATSELHSEHASPMSSPHFSPPISELAPSPGDEGPLATAADMGWGTSPGEPQSPSSAESISLSPIRGAHIRDIRNNRTGYNNPGASSSNRNSDGNYPMSATSGPLGLGIHDREIASESLRRQDSTRSRNSDQTLVSGLTGTNTLSASGISAALHSGQNGQRRPATRD